MRSASLYRMSGQCLMYAGLLWAISMVVVPAAPPVTLAGATARLGFMWTVSGLAWILAAVLAILAIVGVYRHFQDGPREGWALLAVSSNMVGMLGGAIGSMVYAMGVPVLVRIANGAPQPSAYEPAQAALLAISGGIYLTAMTLLWLSLLPLAVAMFADRVWPRAIVWGAVACAVIEAAGPFVLGDHYTARRLLLLLGFAFLVLLGGTIERLGRAPKQAAAPQPEVGAGV